MLNLQTKHYLLLGAMLVAIGTQISGLPSWQAATSPLFLGGMIIQVGLTFGSLFVEKPQKQYTPGTSVDRRDPYAP